MDVQAQPVMPDFLSEFNSALEVAGKQLRILHEYEDTRPLACNMTAGALDEAAQALAFVSADPRAGADVPILHNEVCNRC